MKHLLALLFMFPILTCLAQTPPPAPPVKATGSVQQDTAGNIIFTKVEIESEYPGGRAAWDRYLDKNFHYPKPARKAGIQGTVVVQFIVDRQGSVSDVQAISGPEELREEAVRLIKGSKLWTPAIQNGHQVTAYKKQPIEFKLDAN